MPVPAGYWWGKPIPLRRACSAYRQAGVREREEAVSNQVKARSTQFAHSSCFYV